MPASRPPRSGRLAFGVAYERPGSFTLSFDATLYLPMRYPAPRELLRTGDAGRFHVETEHVDLALGVEGALSPRWVLRGGVYTNTSGATRQDADLRLNHVGATFGVGYLRDGLSTAVGLNALVGAAGPQAVPGLPARVEWRRLQLQLVVGGTARFLE